MSKQTELPVYSVHRHFMSVAFRVHNKNQTVTRQKSANAIYLEHNIT